MIDIILQIVALLAFTCFCFAVGNHASYVMRKRQFDDAKFMLNLENALIVDRLDTLKQWHKTNNIKSCTGKGASMI